MEEKEKCVVCGDLVSIKDTAHATPGCKVLELQAEALKDQPYQFAYGNSQAALYLEDWLRAQSDPKFKHTTGRVLAKFNEGIKALYKLKDEKVFHTLIMLWRESQIKRVNELKVPQKLKNLLMSLIGQKYKQVYRDAELPCKKRTR